MRDDIHKPSLLDPAEYDFIAAFYQGDSQWIGQAYQAEMEVYDAAVADWNVFMGNFFTKQTCDHCGAAFNHGVLFLHIPTDELIHVGHVCAANTVGLPDRAAKARKAAEKFAREEKAKQEQQERTQEWRDENPDVVTWLQAQDTKTAHHFICDMVFTLNRWGALSDRQAAAVRKWMVSDKERAAKKAENEKRLVNAPALEEGRMEIEGKVISTKWVDSQYGRVFKMLVEMENGNRVYGTVANSLYLEMGDEDLKGQRVVFTATVSRSRDDQHFGFFSRPKGARIL